MAKGGRLWILCPGSALLVKSCLPCVSARVCARVRAYSIKWTLAIPLPFLTDASEKFHEEEFFLLRG